MASSTVGIARPNLFTLSGRDISVTVALSGIDGKPRVNYHDTQRILSFTGEEITTEDCALGSLVTVTIVRTPDFGSTTFSVIVPTVNLASSQHEVHTIGITALHRTSIAGIGHGQLTEYTSVKLHGSAEVVEF